MCPVVLVWEHLFGFNMGNRGSGKNGENLGVLMFWGKTTMNWRKKTKTRDSKRGKKYSGVVLE